MAKTQQKPKLKQPTPKIRNRNQTPKGSHGGMEVILTEDVLHVGKQGQVVEVKQGFGRNYLIPRGLAVQPTQHNIKLLEQHKIRVQKAREARIADLKMLADQIHRTIRVSVEANATEDGALYGSVGPQEISRAMRGKNLLVEPHMVHLVEPIKHCGEYPEIEIHLGYEIIAKIGVFVIPQVTSKKL